MDQESERVDGRMVSRDRAHVTARPWWKPSPLASWFLAIVAFDALILIAASSAGSSGNDAARNGMANAVQQVFVEASAVLVGCLALLFLVVRHKRRDRADSGAPAVDRSTIGAAAMTRMLGIVFAGCAMGAASLVAAQDRAASTASKADASKAAELARLIYPEALNRAIVTYTILHVITPTYHADPNLRKLEADHPGIIDAMIAAMRPEFERGHRDALPRLWAQTSAVYAAGLTRDELRQSVAFYASPAGRRLALAEQNAVAHADTGSDQVGVQTDPAKGLEPDDAQARSVFEASATGQRLAALQPQISAIADAWNSARTPEADARIGEAMSEAAARFYDSTAAPIRLTPTSEPTPRGRETAK